MESSRVPITTRIYSMYTMDCEKPTIGIRGFFVSNCSLCPFCAHAVPDLLLLVDFGTRKMTPAFSAPKAGGGASDSRLRTIPHDWNQSA